MAPLRMVGKTSLSDEITMLENLRDKLLSVRGQARLIADSTGDESAKVIMATVAGDATYYFNSVELVLSRAKEAQAEQAAETGRVTLREDLGRY